MPRHPSRPSADWPSCFQHFSSALKLIAWRAKAAVGSDDACMRIRLLLPVAAVAVALAAPAHADDNGNFLMDIKNAGINFGDSSTTVTAGRTVCRMLEHGSSEDEIVSNVEQMNPGVSHAKAQAFEQTAVSDFCPDDVSSPDDESDTAAQPASSPGSGSASGQSPTPGTSAGPPGSTTGTGPPNGTATH